MKFRDNRLLKQFIGRNTWWILLILALIVMADVCRVWAAARVETIVDLLTAHTAALSYVLGFILLSGLIMLGYYVFRFFYQLLGEYLSQKLATLTRVRLTEHLAKIPFRKYEEFATGDIQSTIRNDVRAASQFMRSITMFVTNLFLLLLTGGYMIYVNPTAGVVVVSISVAVAFLNQRILSIGKRSLARMRDEVGALTSVVETSVHGMDTIKTYAAKDYAMRFFMRHKKAYNKASYFWAGIHATRETLVCAIRVGGILASMLYLGFMGIRGEMSLGQVFVFITLMRDFMMPLDVTLGYTAQLTIASIAWGRIGRILGLPADPVTEQAEPYSALESAQVSHVSFSYDGEQDILQDFSLALEIGKSHVLRGESGCGKSTFLKIMTGLYEPKSGTFAVNGAPAEKARFVNSTVFVAANNPLFSMSLYDNICLGNEQITKAQCLQLADQLGIGAWIRSLPDGIDTLVTENGNNLSGGQRQMVNNMRALLSDAVILIFDEPTSALDKDKEARFSAVIDRLKQNRLILITSHRGDVISSCDKVFHF